MADPIRDLLTRAAEEQLGGVHLEDPSRGGTGSPHDSAEPTSDTPGRWRWLLVAAAVLAVVGGVATWALTGDDDTVRVETPPDGTQPTEPGHPVDQAIAATLATSWVADMSFSAGEGGPAEPPAGQSTTVTYNPPDPASGRDDAIVEMVTASLVDERAGTASGQMGDEEEPGSAEAAGEQLRTMFSGERRYAECGSQQAEPCRPGAWVDMSSETLMSQPEDWEQRQFAQLSGIAGVELSSPEPLEPGIWAVRGNGLLCSDADCRGTIEIRDGLVVSLSVASMGESYTWNYRSFGEAPRLELPDPDDVVSIAGDAEVICDLLIEVLPGTDIAAVEAEARDWIQTNGRDSVQDLMVTLGPDSGVQAWSNSTDEGCLERPYELSVTEIDPARVPDNEFATTSTVPTTAPPGGP